MTGVQTCALPICFRRFLTKLIVRHMTSFLMPVEDVLNCDRDPDYRDILLNQYKERYPKKTEWLQRKTKKCLDSYSLLADLDEGTRTSMKKQMEYAFFAYGFYPDEFLFFDLGGKNKDINHFRTFVSETERWPFRFAANDFTNTLLSGKADTYNKFSSFYKRDVLVIDKGSRYSQFLEFVEKHPSFVYKKVSSSRGDGVTLVEKVDNKKDFFKKAKQDGKILLEERICQSKEMSVFNETSVNTIRLSSYNTRNGIFIVHGFFRSGRKGVFIDNAAKGGIFAVVDAQKGIIISDGYDEFGGVYKIHPDSNVEFRNYRFPDWEEARKICIEITGMIPRIKYISFDLSYTKNGWDIVEINPSGQYLHQTGQAEGFREELRDLIQNMDLMTPYHLRKYC